MTRTELGRSEHASGISHPDAASTDSIIRFAGVGKTFAKAASAALTDITLDIHRGEIFAVIGYSGAGKSTLVRLINGLEKVTTGTVDVDGTRVSDLREGEMHRVRGNIGMVFQQFNLMKSRTVFGNIEFALIVAGWTKADRTERIWELLDFVGLTEKAWMYPEQLSGGQRQRVGIARALAAKPSVLLADEATSALDPETTHEVLQLLARTNHELGVTVVVITHEMDVVRSIADRVAVLDNGHLVELGTTYELFANPQTERAKAFLAAVSQTEPNAAQVTSLRERGHERLFTIHVTRDLDVGGLLSEAVASYGIRFALLFGGIDIIQQQQFGSLTVALSGDRVDEALALLREHATVEELAA